MTNKMVQILMILTFLLASFSKAEMTLVEDDTSEINKISLAIAKAAPVIFTDQFCSGSFISNSGYYLTALHCLRNLLPAENIEIFKDNPKFGTIEGINYRDPRRKIVLQSGNEAGWFRQYNMNVKTATLEIAGSGSYTQFSDPKILTDLGPEDIQQLSCFNQDFAILKFDLPRRVSCLKFAKDGLARTLDASIYGYSDHILNSSRRLVGTVNLYRSTGLAYSNNDPLILDTFKGSNGMYDSSVSALSMIPVFPGMSGSSVLNSKHEILGVAIVGFGDQADMGIPSRASMFVQSSFIRKYVEEKIGTQRAEEIFSCDP